MKNLAVLIFLFSCPFLYGQEEGDSTKTNQPWSFKTAEKILKFSPMDLISVVPTFSADLELELKENISLQFGLGYAAPGFQYLSNSSLDMFDKIGGYRIRGESRFYVFNKATRYFSTEISFRHLIIRDEIGVGMEPSTQQDEWGFEEVTYAYFEKINMIFHRFNTAINLKYGFQKEWDNGFRFDMYTGLSIRKTNVQSKTRIPEGGSVPDNWNPISWTLEDNYTNGYATPIFGFKMGFVIK